MRQNGFGPEVVADGVPEFGEFREASAGLDALGVLAGTERCDRGCVGCVVYERDFDLVTMVQLPVACTPATSTTRRWPRPYLAMPRPDQPSLFALFIRKMLRSKPFNKHRSW